MFRRLRIGVVSPSKGSSFGLNAASYPPPSALSNHPELLLCLRELNSFREEAIKAKDDAKALRYSRLFIETASHLDNFNPSMFPRAERLEAVKFKKTREKLLASLEALLSVNSVAKAKPTPQNFSSVSFKVPEHFSGFGKTLNALNRELIEIHSDPALPSEVKAALGVMAESFNSLISSDASEISELHNSKQYIASLRISDHYERMARELLWCARARDLSAMVELASSFGVNLPKLLYKKGVYLKMGKPAPKTAPIHQKKL